jgi:hypothetical protein
MEDLKSEFKKYLKLYLHAKKNININKEDAIRDFNLSLEILNNLKAKYPEKLMKHKQLIDETESECHKYLNLSLESSIESDNKKKFDIVFYNRNYKSKKNFLIQKIILNLPKKIKICVIGDKFEGVNLFNYGYVSHKKTLKLISQSKMAFGSSENSLSLFAIDCYNSGVRLIFDRDTLLDNIISKKNIILIDYKNYIDSSEIITSTLFNSKFKIDISLNKFLDRKFFLLDKFLRNYFIF